jgi:hypothetical protein
MILIEEYIKFHFTVNTPPFLFLIFKPILQNRGLKIVISCCRIL